jgi:Spy/CpxP family protein refolding chaperone
MSIRRTLPLALLAGALAIPALYAQSPGSDESQRTPDTAPAPNRYMGPGGPNGGRFDADGWGGQRGWGNHGGFRGMRGWHRGMGDMMLARIAQNPEMRERLGITPEQATKIRQETFEIRKARIRDRADVELKGAELENLMSAETPDRAAIDKKLDELGAARLVEVKAAVHYHLAMREVLTPEQRQKLRAMLEKHAHGRRGFQGPPQGAPRGPRGPRPPVPNQE